MDNSNGIGICSMGVVNAFDLDGLGNARRSCFSVKEARAHNPEWGPAASREEVAYVRSSETGSLQITRKLMKFSISGRRGYSPWRTLQDALYCSLGRFHNGEHLFCIHSGPNHEFYYGQPILHSIDRFRSHRKPFPRCIIITTDGKRSKSVMRGLLNKRRSSNSTRPNTHITNLDTTELSNEFMTSNRSRVFIGSFKKIKEYIDKLKNEMEQLDDFISVLRFVIITNAEKLKGNSEFADSLGRLAQTFESSLTRFIFAYHFSSSVASLTETLEFCKGKMERPVLIEADNPRVRDVFSNIECKLVRPISEIASLLPTQESTLENNNISPAIVSQYLTESTQKLKILTMLIKKERDARAADNGRSGRRDKPRRERILVITRTTETCIRVMMYLRLKMQTLAVNLRYNIHKITTCDSEEDVEKRNFEFRTGNLDVLVIDWRSIRAVHRGAVDTIVMFDSPHPLYFQTIMETELQNLASIIGVKLKLYMIIDQNKDFRLVREYLKFLECNKTRAPTWFRDLYQKYLADRQSRTTAAVATATSAVPV